MTPGHLGEWRQLEHSSAPSRASFQVLCGSLGQATGSGPSGIVLNLCLIGSERGFEKL